MVNPSWSHFATVLTSVRSFTQQPHQSNSINTNGGKEAPGNPDNCTYIDKDTKLSSTYSILISQIGLTAFNGSILVLAINRYDYDAFLDHTTAKTFERVGLMYGLKLFAQGVGATIITPLRQRVSSRMTLVLTVLLFGLINAMLLIIDACTGGTIVPDSFVGHHPKQEFHYYGDYGTNVLIPVYSLAGVAYGMVELIVHVVLHDIVDGHLIKLHRLESLAYLSTELVNIVGTLFVGLVRIPHLGASYAFIVTPACFAVAVMSWSFLQDNALEGTKSELSEGRPSYFSAMLINMLEWSVLILVGAQLVFTRRKYVWLWPCSSVLFYTHQYLETAIPAPHHAALAWCAAASFIPIMFAWVVVDASLAAHAQETLARMNPIYIDRVYRKTGHLTEGGDIHEALFYVGAVQISIVSLLVLMATVVPRSSMA
ncbi:uncharacterized protein BO97DRAFT_470401 [Aspergillus homomorphus CBS 101889]|uniref:Uncharacterized protein n=1 Tax=Aspergillus homomorphus (strain CBS 101889) TaxID=1450537 RepID=A0A395HXL6_ASPHC|nr:hypothetical protein BO97DRAFT_470401 [Aspergillus homomorphus CBS 101889]RAL12175.1 hypothetical protein BO97DRAFT_470401 [Aspergillus homomorphus CBS 101889]